MYPHKFGTKRNKAEQSGNKWNKAEISALVERFECGYARSRKRNSNIATENKMMTNQLLSDKDLARMLQVAIVTIRRWRMFGTGPDYIRCGRGIRYQIESVNKWLMDRNSRRSV